MIKTLEDNDVCQVINLMNHSIKNNDYNPYPKNERCWIQHLLAHIEMCKDDPKYIAIGDFEDKWLKGFLLASAYRNYYTQELVMDVKDCIVNPEVNNVYTVTRLFNFMINHLEYHGGRYWRADSIASSSPEYVEFLKKKYNAVPFHGVHGEI